MVHLTHAVPMRYQKAIKYYVHSTRNKSLVLCLKNRVNQYGTQYAIETH